MKNLKYYQLNQVYFKVNIIFIIVFLISTQLSGQRIFSRVFQGDIVNDSGISAGVSWGDYNNDGFYDVFVANWNNQNNYLYRNNGDRTFTKILEGEIVNDSGYSSGPCWGDYNNDGYLDLFVTNQQNQNNCLYKNNKDGNFTKITEGDIVNDYGDSYTSAWGDYDNDGYLDLFVANSNQNNFLYKNNGNGKFTKIKEGSIVNDGGFSFGASWGDYDNDGYIDLFVANKNEENNFLYKNNGDGSFTKITKGIIVNDGGNSNGGSWADYNNDGDLDLFVANGPFFFDGQDNFLYQNNGEGTFTKIANDPVVMDFAKSTSGTWGDFDNDGDLDLFVSTYVHDDLLYLNNSDGSFIRVREGLLANLAGFAAANAICDFDNDGDQDLFIPNWENQNNIIYRNNTNGSNWVQIKCEGVKSNKQAIGTKIKITSMINDKKTIQYRELRTNNGFRSQNNPGAHFGLGETQTVEYIEIKWPSGKSDKLTNIKSNQVLTIAEGKGIINQFSPPIFVQKPPVGQLILQKIDEAGIQEAIKLYNTLKKENQDDYDFSEQQLNFLGYRLLQGGRIDEAIEIFKLNVESFPVSGNTYDSLCEAFIANGNYNQAVEYSKKLLEIISDDTNINENFRELLTNGAKYRLKNLQE
jgi:tetratricopeptide (TPR) repeat protein